MKKALLLLARVALFASVIAWALASVFLVVLAGSFSSLTDAFNGNHLLPLIKLETSLLLIEVLIVLLLRWAIRSTRR